MDHSRESFAKLSHERGKHIHTPNVRPNAHFNEELSTFTSRVVRAENACSKHINTHNCGDAKNQEPAATKSQVRCAPNSYTQTGADQGVEHIVLEKIYYAIRNDSDNEDVFLNPKERSLGAGNSKCDESVQLEAEEGSDSWYFGGSNFNDYRKDNKERQERQEENKIWTCERSNVRHKWPIQEVHSSLPDKFEQPLHKRCNRRTVLQINQSAPSKEVSSRLRRPSLLRSDCQVQDSIIIADSPLRAGYGDYQGTGQNTSWEFPEVSSSDKRFQETNFQGISNQYSAENSVDMSAVSKQNGDVLVYPFLTQNRNCAAKGAAIAYETPSSSTSIEESDMNFLKLRNTVEQVVLKQIRRQMGNTGETGEAEMLVRVAEDILSKAKGIGQRAKCQTQTADIAKSTNNPRQIVRPVGVERSHSVLTRQDHTLVSQSMTSPPVAEARPTTSTSPQVNGEYPQGSVIRSVLDFSREASKRTRQNLGDACSQDIIRPKYARKEGMSELITNEKVSPDSRTDLHFSQEVLDSSQQVRHRQSEWIEQDILVVENPNSWRSNSGKQQDKESEFQDDIDEDNEKDTTSQRVTEHQDEIVCNVTNERASRHSGSAFRLCQSNPNRADLAYAGELNETINRHSPFSADDCLEIHRSHPAETSQQSTPTPLHSSEGDSFGQPLDGISGLTYPVDQGYKFPASIFKQARTMRQDIHATLRVFSTMFQPFSCSQRYTTASHQSRASNQKSGHSTSNSRTTRLSQDSHNSPTSSSLVEGYSRDSQELQQMGCSSHTHEDRGDQNVEICSLQNAPENVEKPRNGLSADSGNETSTIEETAKNQTGGSAEDPPSCFENLSDNSPETSSGEEMTEVPTVAADDSPCFDNLGDNSLSREEGQEMQEGLPGDPPSRFENLSDISQEMSSREGMTVMPSGGAEEGVPLKETSSDCGQSCSKRSQPSCTKCCNGSLGHGKYRNTSKELLNATRWTNEKLFVCPWLNCDWRFKRNDELTRHWRTHTGEKPYPCSRCKKSFGRRDRLRSHMKTHVDKVEMGCTKSKSIQS